MPASDDALVRDLSRLLEPDRVMSGSGARAAYECDAYPLEKRPPTAVVLPTSTDEVQAVVLWCNENQVPFTPRGAGTGLSGGAMPALGGVVISTKRMTNILETDIANRRMHAQSGVVNANLTKAVRAHGLHFAPDPSSQSVSTLGGNIAENSGGPHTLKYGVTAQHILSLTMISPNGERLELGSLTPDGPGSELMRLVIGGEGTLGVVTEAWVRLTPLPEAVSTSLLSFADVHSATRVVAEVISSGIIPAALELMDAGILEALRLAFGLPYPDGAQALMLVECDGAPADVERDIAGVLAVANRVGCIESRVAASEAERAQFWLARKKGIGAMGRLAPSIVTHDGVIPRSKLPEIMEYISEIAREAGVGVANLFHAGDGNLHPCMYFDDRDPRQVEAVMDAGEKIIRKCLELGGSVTGEHGIGVEKTRMLAQMFGPTDMDLQADMKRIFNPGMLCNPCKVLPDQKGCVEHMRRYRGAAT